MDIVAMGELLIDFTSIGTSESGQRIFEQNPGGAPANVACCVSVLGAEAGFIGKVGNDMHGRFLKKVIEEKGVDSSGLVMTDDFFTTLAFVDIRDGEREFSFARKPGADTQLRSEELNRELLKSTKVLSLGSLSLTDEPARSASFEAVRTAKEAGAVIAYDPNYRAPLWCSAEEAREHMRSMLPLTDMLKISDEETSLMTDREDPAQAAEYLSSLGIQVVCVTLGARGALVCVDGKTAEVEGFKCRPVDTTGAGDSFWGGFLYSFVKGGKDIKDITLEDARSYALFGNACAACCVVKNGGIPAMPELDVVTGLINNR